MSLDHSTAETCSEQSRTHHPLYVSIDHSTAETCSEQSITHHPLYMSIDHPTTETCSGQSRTHHVVQFTQPSITLLQQPAHGQSITKIRSPSTPFVTTLLQKSAPGNYHSLYISIYSHSAPYCRNLLWATE